MEGLLFRNATTDDLTRIMTIIRQAQAQMRAAGSDQWQDGYPSAADIERDIAAGTGRVLCRTPHRTADDGRRAAGNAPESGSQSAAKERPDGSDVIAYGAVAFDGEPAYEALEGEWRSDLPYVVLHRLAVADEAKRQGVAGEFLRRTEALALRLGIRSFRIDTSFDNRYMLRLLERQGFVYCGKVRYRNGERLAFEKRPDQNRLVSDTNASRGR